MMKLKKRIQERISRSEPRTEVRRQLNFQYEYEYDEADRQEKARYMRRLEPMMREDEKTQGRKRKRRKDQMNI